MHFEAAHVARWQRLGAYFAVTEITVLHLTTARAVSPNELTLLEQDKPTFVGESGVHDASRGRPASERSERCRGFVAPVCYICELVSWTYGQGHPRDRREAEHNRSGARSARCQGELPTKLQLMPHADCNVVGFRFLQIPFSSANPELSGLMGASKRVVVYNKADLSNGYLHQHLRKYHETLGERCVFTNAAKGDGVPKVCAQRQ